MPEVSGDERNATVAVYPDHEGALEGLEILRDGGFDAGHVSVVGKGVKHTQEVHGWVPSGSEAKHYGKWGALWGALTGWLMLGFVWLPGIGWVAAGGWLVATLVGAGLGAGLGALVGLGVPADMVPEYEEAIKAEHYLVIVHGDVESVKRAQDLLEKHGLARVRAFFPADVAG